LPSQTDLASESIDEKAMLNQELPPTKQSLSQENLRKGQTPSDILKKQEQYIHARNTSW
jgi:hypothetical protein